MWPLCVAMMDGGNLFSSLVVNPSNVVRFPASIAFMRVARVEEISDIR